MAVLARELDRLDRLIHRAILRLRAGYELSLDEFRGLYVSDEQVDALVRAHAAPSDLVPVPPAPEPEPGTPWARLVDTFGLGLAERDILLAALAPELDRRYETLFAYLNNDVTRKWPTADLVLRLFDDDPTLQAALLPEAPLTVRGLVERLAPPAERRPERLRELAASLAVARFVQGLPLPLPHGVRRLPGLPDGDLGPLPRRHDRMAPLLLLEGERGLGRLAAARALAGDTDMLVVDAAAIAADGWPAAARELALLAHLGPALVYVDASAMEGAGPVDFAKALAVLAAGAPPICLALAPDHPVLATLCHLPLLRVPFTEPDRAGRRRLWAASLAGHGIATPDATLDAVADRFRLTPGQIARASRSAVLARGPDDPEASIPADRLFRAAREQSALALGRLATRVRPRAGWDDLVLPPATLARLREIAAAVANRELVQHVWGMGRLSAAPDGLAALFQGPPGTGKTMAASVIAQGLGLDLYRVDLATVVSKYIGETEKNLDRIFQAARGSNAVLLFDEADALFGKRSEVKDAHDRYANLEIAYLLQRMEEHDGPVILATNLAKNLDQAFTRRLHYVVEFPRPDTAARERLWRAMLAPPLPTAPEVDHALLAQRFELTGGQIRKSALEAAFAAAADGGIVGMPALVGTLQRELARQGRVAPAVVSRALPAMLRTES